MTNRIHVNPVAPQKLVVTCLAGGALDDMTRVVSCIIKLKKPGGTVVTLACSITAKTHDSLTLSHMFELGEVDRTGSYKLYVSHALDVGSVRTDVLSFTAIDSFE